MTHRARLIALAASLALIPALVSGCGGEASTASTAATTAGRTPGSRGVISHPASRVPSPPPHSSASGGGVAGCQTAGTR